MQLNLSVVGTLSVGAKTFSAAGVQVIPPFRGAAGPFLYSPSAGNRFMGDTYTHINTVGYTTLGTAHLIGIMRPFNYTWLTAAIASAGTGLTIYDDPGLYSTNMKYPATTTTGTATVGNNAIAAGDYVVLQLNDGSWHVSTIASGTFGGGNLVLTTAVPTLTGGGASVGAPVYFFGVIGDSNPQTGQINPQTTIAASQTRDATWTQVNAGIVASLNPGDPMMFYTPNTTNNGTLEFIAGFFARI